MVIEKEEINNRQEYSILEICINHRHHRNLRSLLLEKKLLHFQLTFALIEKKTADF
jgi:hypothetical protein